MGLLESMFTFHNDFVQDMMMTLFSPHRVTLMFVIRDKSKTPLEILERDLKKDVRYVTLLQSHQPTSKLHKVNFSMLKLWPFLIMNDGTRTYLKRRKVEIV